MLTLETTFDSPPLALTTGMYQVQVTPSIFDFEARYFFTRRLFNEQDDVKLTEEQHSKTEEQHEVSSSSPSGCITRSKREFIERTDQHIEKISPCSVEVNVKNQFTFEDRYIMSINEGDSTLKTVQF